MTPVTYFTHIYTKFAKERHILKKGTSLQLNKGTKCRFMHNYHITPLNVLKKSQLKTALAILLFIASYFLLNVSLFSFILLNIFFLFQLIWWVPNSFMVLLFIILMVLTILLLIAHLTFILQKTETDTSAFIPVTEDQQVDLFSSIREVVQHLQTPFPTKVYLSKGIELKLIYPASFWNLFLPVKKELIIGMGLIQATSVSEFKALLAHELGHYSKKPLFMSTRLFYMHQILFKLVHEGPLNREMSLKRSNPTGILAYVSPFVFLPVKGIHWILSRLYQYLMHAYQPLATEFAFQADENAAEMMGSQPLIKGIMRYELALLSFDMVLEYFHQRKAHDVRTKNLYVQYKTLMNFLAKKNQLPFEKNLPLVEKSQLSRYQVTKLLIHDQWASHPTISERTKRLELLPYFPKEINYTPAIHLLNNSLALEERLTLSHFQPQARANFTDRPIFISRKEFMEEYTKRYEAFAFHDMFNHYYDDRNPSRIQTDEAEQTYAFQDIFLEELFSDSTVDWVYTLMGLENDVATLKLIAKGEFRISSFDYDGQKYSLKQVDQLIVWLQLEIHHYKQLLSQNDEKIFVFFSTLAKKQSKHAQFMASYLALFQIGDTFKDQLNMYFQISDAISFLETPLSEERLQSRLRYLQNIEHQFKKRINYLLEADIYQSHLSNKIRHCFLSYLAQEGAYYVENHLRHNMVHVLTTAVQYFYYLIPIPFYHRKRALLNLKVELVNHY